MTDEDLSQYRASAAKPMDVKFYNGDLYQRWETEYYEKVGPASSDRPKRILSKWVPVPKQYGGYLP